MVAFLPYQATMLDVRDMHNRTENGYLPQSFIKAWLNFLENYINDQSNYRDMEDYLKKIFQEGARTQFLEPLKKRFLQGEKIKIREKPLLGIFANDENGLIDVIFQKFMLSLGYDGMIYREGGEGQKRKELTGYVFYNYKAVDTYEGWQRRNSRTDEL
mgnify:CR=1 FL=1